MNFKRISASIYGGLIMARHPEAIGLRRLGISYEHYRDLHQPWLLEMNIRTILDVGANVGQFATLAHAVFPSARIFSFEPLPDCFEELKLRLPENSQAFNMALGDRNAELDFYRASTCSPASSFLRMTKLHVETFPETRDGQEATPVKVKVRRLDEIASELELVDNILLKLDVQGYEDKVIAAGTETLKRVSVAIVETSFLPLYDGQVLFGDVHELLLGSGFVFQGNLNQQFHPVDGRIVSADSIFVRPPANSG
jgi:FkbM family methyltransferase